MSTDGARTDVTRVGFVVPSSNVRVEPMACRMLQGCDSVTAHFSRVTVESVDPGRRSGAQFDVDRLYFAAEQLTHLAVSAIAWAGTSGSWRGLEEDRRFVRAVASTLGTSATTSCLAVLKACAQLSVRDVALVTPFTDPIVARITNNLNSEGINILREGHFSIGDSLECSQVPSYKILSMIDHLVDPDIDAVVVLCTNFGIGSGSESLEQRLGIPVIDSVSATIWDTLSLAGEWQPRQGSGSLLASTAGDAVATIRSRSKNTR